MNKKFKKLKIGVALSGGVDSAVAAAVLKNKGHDLTAFYMRLIDSSESKKSEKNARSVAKILGIRFFVFDFRKEFKKKIIDYFSDKLKKGLTPNPCVVCNKQIKFGLLLKKANSLKLDFLATGHYIIKKNESRIFKGKDELKDQSYFLWSLDRNQLKKIIFPLGEMTKKEVRGLAKKLKLPVVNSPESQEICFARDGLYNFFSNKEKIKKGKILDFKKNVIGEHKGLVFYTIGQRKGIGLPGGPYYVSSKNLKANSLMVTKNPKDLEKKKIKVEKVNWITENNIRFPLKAEVKIRYRQKEQRAQIMRGSKKGNVSIIFSKPQRAVTPGQSAVFYKGKELLGGGIIF